MSTASLVLAAVLSAPSFTATAAAATVPAVAADAFCDSIGVNIHVHYQGSVYDHATNLKAALQKLGVRHVRDGLVDSQWPTYFERLNDLGRSGIHCTVITGMPMARVLPLAAQAKEAIEAFEGPNEVNLNGWTVERAAQYQKDLWTTIRADAAWNQDPILCLSVTDYDYGARLGDLSAFADCGNIHPYPGGWEPENGSAWMKADLPTGLAGGRKITGSKPMMITETGYTTHRAKAGHVAVTPEMAGIYLPRMLLHTFASGVKRTFIYELFDLHDDPQDPEANFGLIRSDGVTFKPAGIAMGNLLTVLRDPGAPFAAAPLDVTLSEAQARSALFQKRDGVYYLVVWLPSNLWDQSRPYGQKQQSDPPDLPCTITFARAPKAVTGITGLDATLNEKVLVAAKTVSIVVSERVTVLRIVP
ncbi:MAG: hypothetical protein H0X38_10230 [Planctomycetes bacterium]|nr:hypothetical protein [Planctomycetota bacterium]